MSRNPTYNKLVRVVISTTDADTDNFQRLDLITAICREFEWSREQFLERVKEVEAAPMETTR